MKNIFKGTGLRPAPQENVMKLYSAPLFGLIYNMLKNSESVTFFFKKKSPRLSPGQYVKGNHNYNKAGFISRKEYVFYFYWFPPTYNMQNHCPHKLAPRGQVTKKGKKNLASKCNIPGR